ncbi:MAG TPA: preprotein translocase subunit YajC [Candidatus Galloscillospira stercoripullorum]|nr:preprotein translocase subunit YajC [Candidatus Galloscillospira stercoripullorum]
MPTDIITTVVMMVVVIGVFYFLMIRPESKRKKETQKMLSELSVGDQVTTIGGIRGTICAVKEDTVVIESGADRVRIEFNKSAIGSKNTASQTK